MYTLLSWKCIGLIFICFSKLVVQTLGNSPHSSSSFGEGTGPIFIQQTHCSGSESSLLKCSRDIIPITYINCNHLHEHDNTTSKLMYDSKLVYRLMYCTCTCDSSIMKVVTIDVSDGNYVSSTFQ